MLRAFVLVVGVVAAACGLVMMLGGKPLWPVGVELFVFGLLVVIGTAFERWRYRPAAARGTWQPTGEKFVDPTSGERVEVFYDPLSGERDYRPAAR